MYPLLLVLTLLPYGTASRVSLDVVLDPVVQIARCRAECLKSYKHVGVTVTSDVKCRQDDSGCGECWMTCGRLVDAPHQASSICEHSNCVRGCVLACSIMRTTGTSGSAIRSYWSMSPPLVTVTGHRVHLLWSTPVSQAESARPQFVYVLLWRADNSSDWMQLKQTIDIQAVFVDRSIAHATESQFWLLAVTGTGVVSQTGIVLNDQSLIADRLTDRLTDRQSSSVNQSVTDSQWRWSVVFVGAVCIAVFALALLITVLGLLVKMLISRVRHNKDSLCHGYALRRELGVSPGHGYLSSACELKVPEETYVDLDTSLYASETTANSKWCVSEAIVNQTDSSINDSSCQYANQDESPAVHKSGAADKPELIATPTRLWPHFVLNKYRVAERCTLRPTSLLAVHSSISGSPVYNGNSVNNGNAVPHRLTMPSLEPNACHIRFSSPCTSCATGVPFSPVYI